MLCQSCYKRDATIQYVQFVNGEKTEIYLCRECANLSDPSNLGLNPSISSILASLMGNAYFEQPLYRDNSEDLPSLLDRLENELKEISELKNALEEAIDAEKYEKAAEIRDKIKKIEAKNQQ